VHNHSYENEFHLQVNEISFLSEWLCTKTRFEKKAKGNSEMAYCPPKLSQIENQDDSPEIAIERLLVPL